MASCLKAEWPLAGPSGGAEQPHSLAKLVGHSASQRSVGATEVMRDRRLENLSQMDGFLLKGGGTSLALVPRA